METDSQTAAGAEPTPEPQWWLALYRAPGIGPATFHSLLERFGTPAAVFQADAQQLAACGLAGKTLRYLRAPAWKAVERDLAWLERRHNHLLTCHNPRYPRLLREIQGAPPLLFVHGNADILGDLQLAVVGSRNPTQGGAQTARDFAAHLAACGLTITSGLALGIDAAGHRGALDAGGTSIAVTGTGLDQVYPARHSGLAREIAQSGALVSEFPPGTRPAPENFPRRNRIISGLSLGTLVVEAALRSGSLITAQHALEQGREVFAIPGSIHNPLARGCHRLIRQGAGLVETVEDILGELAPLARASLDSPAAISVPAGRSGPGSELRPDHRRVVEALGYEPTPVDVLIERTGLTAEEVSSILLILELRGLVAPGPGGMYSRVLQ